MKSISRILAQACLKSGSFSRTNSPKVSIDRISRTAQAVSTTSLAYLQVMQRPFQTQSKGHYSSYGHQFRHYLKAITKHIFPTHAYREQKRYLRRHLKKPKDMKVRKFATRIVELNSCFAHFPSATGENWESLHEDEVIEIIYHSLPSSWRKQIILQGFYFVEQTIDSMVNFLEERVEHWEPTHPELAKKPKANKKRKAAHFSTGSSSTSEEEEEPSIKRKF